MTRRNSPAFGDNGNFIGATFGDWAMFTRATFGQSNFSGATFGDHAVFTRAMFDGSAFFDGVTFSDNANFSGASIGDEAVFDRSAFGVNTTFDRAAFSGRVCFDGAAFHFFSFSPTRHLLTGSRSPAPRSEVMQILQAPHSVPCLPRRRDVCGRSLFTGASFGGGGAFRGTHFKGEVDFTGQSRSNGPGMLQMRMGITGLRKLLHCQSTHLRTISLRNGQARNYD